MDTLDNLSLKQIQYFTAVAEYGSFRQAAFRLNITQPTLSSNLLSLKVNNGSENLNFEEEKIKLTFHGVRFWDLISL